MAGLMMHAVVYVVVNGLLVILWVVLFGGSWSDVQEVAQDPSVARSVDFWPIWPILLWGAALLIHAGAVVSFGLFGRRARRRRKEMAVKAAEGIKEHKRRRREERRERKAPPTGRQWVVVMFTDIARSTPLAESLGDEAWADLLVEHRSVVRKCIASNDGEEVGTQGDGFLVRFDRPDDAVNCALAIQERLDERRRNGAFTPSVRVGIHAGEAVRNDEDLVGRVVNLASRVVDQAEPNEILMTEPVADHLERRVAITDRGLHELKGVSQPRHLLGVEWQNAEVIVLDEEGRATTD